MHKLKKKPPMCSKNISFMEKAMTSPRSSNGIESNGGSYEWGYRDEETEEEDEELQQALKSPGVLLTLDKV